MCAPRVWYYGRGCRALCSAPVSRLPHPVPVSILHTLRGVIEQPQEPERKPSPRRDPPPFPRPPDPIDEPPPEIKPVPPPDILPPEEPPSKVVTSLRDEWNARVQRRKGSA
jgi:hypothetical protein